MLTLHVPIKTVSEANRASHEHWRVRWKRAKTQRETIKAHWLAAVMHEPLFLPARVTLTRIAPRALDDDNLVGSMKAVRDEVAKMLGVDDRSTLIAWFYKQQKGSPKQYATRIEIDPWFA